MYSGFPKKEYPTQTNFVDLFVAWPGNAGSTAIMVICYTLVLVELRKSRRAVAGSISSTQEAKKKAKEVRLAIQFLIIALVYVMVWAMFRILPILIGNSSLEVYVIVPLLANANCTVNPVIYLGKRPGKCRRRHWRNEVSPPPPPTRPGAIRTFLKQNPPHHFRTSLLWYLLFAYLLLVKAWIPCRCLHVEACIPF